MALHLVTGHAGAEHVTGADQGSLNIGLIGSGQFVFDRGNKFAASIYSNNIIRIADGDLIMQGRHIRQKEKTYEECVFENGTQGMLRNDLICVRYTTSVEGQYTRYCLNEDESDFIRFILPGDYLNDDFKSQTVSTAFNTYAVNFFENEDEDTINFFFIGKNMRTSSGILLNFKMICRCQKK